MIHVIRYKFHQNRLLDRTHRHNLYVCVKCGNTHRRLNRKGYRVLYTAK